MCERKCWNTSTTNCEGYGTVWMAERLSLDLHAVSVPLVFSYSFVGDEANTENIAFQMVIIPKWTEV